MSDERLDKAKKEFRGMGFTVVVLGILSALFLDRADHGVATGTVIAMGLCAITGVWLAAKPSVPIGVAAGASLALLGVFDLLLVGEAKGGLAFAAPLIDFGFAVRVFYGCASYAKLLRAPAEQTSDDGSTATPEEDQKKE